MNKNMILILLICMAVLMAGCVTHGETNTTSGETLPPETQEQTLATTETTIPGLEDSIFDDVQWTENTGNTAEGETQPENDNSGENPSETTGETEPPYAESQPEGSQGGEDSGEMTYEKYNSMSGDDQMAFFSTFASVEDFVTWYNAAKEKYEAENPYIEIEGGEIDLDSIFGSGT